MASKRPLEPTTEEAAERLAKKREERRAKKLQVQAPTSVDTKSAIVQRPWIRCSATPPDGFHVKVLTWNLLAQCLIRRELFPTSDCLKAKEREGMTFNELFIHNPDIMCLQEVDRLEKILPALDRASYSYHYAAGPKKKHGCVIAFKKNAYIQVGDYLVHYDNEFVRDSGEDNARIGASFRTKNIGSIVALQETNRPGHGVIVATTHLFWHPRYTYERARQAGILKRAVLRFRSEKGLDHWPCIVSGDFNFAPDDPAYALLVGDSLYPGHDELIKLSHVVHSTIDPTVIPADSSTSTKEDGDESGDADKTITSARSAVAGDGLLSLLELQQFYQSTGVPLRSAYDEGLRQIADTALKPTTFGDRLNLAPSRLGAFEPQWTSYTHYWKTVLDYIFIIDPKDATSSSVVSSVLEPHKTETIAKGLPQLGVCGSDHVSLCAEIIFTQR